MKNITALVMLCVMLSLLLVSPAIAGKPGSQVGADQEQTRGDVSPDGPTPSDGPEPSGGDATNPQGEQDQDQSRGD